mgnify:CR=1 FL=1
MPTESDIKKAVADYLQYKENQGKLWYARLNAGDFIETRGNTRRRIKGVGKGTADLIVIQSTNVQTQYKGQAKGSPYPIARVTFVECKSSKGKPSKEQLEFAERVMGLNCRYFVVRSVEEVQNILGDKG